MIIFSLINPHFLCSGKIHDGELLLEVNDESVVGLTLFDLNNLIMKAKDPVRFKTVKEGKVDLILEIKDKFPTKSYKLKL